MSPDQYAYCAMLVFCLLVSGLIFTAIEFDNMGKNEKNDHKNEIKT